MNETEVEDFPRCPRKFPACLDIVECYGMQELMERLDHTSTISYNNCKIVLISWALPAKHTLTEL